MTKLPPDIPKAAPRYIPSWQLYHDLGEEVLARLLASAGRVLICERLPDSLLVMTMQPQGNSSV